MLGLRTRDGIRVELLSGRDLSRVEKFTVREGGRIRLTRDGLSVMNSVLTEII